MLYSKPLCLGGGWLCVCFFVKVHDNNAYHCKPYYLSNVLVSRVRCSLFSNQLEMDFTVQAIG